MKRFLPILLLAVLLASCASIKIDEPAGTFEYSRWGNQELIDVGIKVDKSPDGHVKLNATLGSQKSDREIAEVLLAVSENIDKALQILMEIEQKFPGIMIP